MYSGTWGTNNSRNKIDRNVDSIFRAKNYGPLIALAIKLHQAVTFSKGIGSAAHFQDCFHSKCGKLAIKIEICLFADDTTIKI